MKIIKVTCPNKDLVYEELSSEWSYIDRWQLSSVIKENERLIKNKFDVKNIDKIKTYYFIPGTKFDRDYFKRLYPELTYTRKIENVGVVFYDDKTIVNALFERDGSKYNGGYYWEEDNKTTYLFDDYVSRDLFWTKTKNRPYYAYGQLIRKIENKYDGKLLDVDTFFSNRKSSILKSEVSAEYVLSIIPQLLTKSIAVQKAGVEILLGLSNELQLTKDLLLTLISNTGKIGSSKLDFYIKNCRKFEFRNSRYYPVTIFQFADTFFGAIEKGSFQEKDKELALQVLNSKEFQSHYINYDGKFKLTFELPETVATNSSSDISGFVL